MLLEEKVAVVTGSSRGFGAEIARTLAREGARVVVCYHRDQEGEDELARTVAQEVGAELVVPFDVRDRSSVRDLMSRTAERYGRIDVLVNNAGINVVGDFDRITEEQWDAVLDTNLKGVFLCCQEALPHLTDGGRVINIGSVSGQYGGPRTPSYAAAKAGVMALTHCLARFVAPRGITVNCVSPGTIGSEMLDRTMPADLKEKILPNVLLGRLGTVQEVAETVLFLASPGASYITAQTIGVNGGLWV
ncbi:MAG: 3-oxoacyl-ACP reductase FabG [Planctomycetota bacterium]|nr:3-oxoacyl-ACP reductase FabG [Planctomycetota bacterium]